MSDVLVSDSHWWRARMHGGILMRRWWAFVLAKLARRRQRRGRETEPAADHPPASAPAPYRWALARPAIKQSSDDVSVFIPFPMGVEPTCDVEVHGRAVSIQLAISQGEGAAPAPEHYRRTVVVPCDVEPDGVSTQCGDDGLTIRLRKFKGGDG